MFRFYITRAVDGRQTQFELTHEELMGAAAAFDKRYFYDEIRGVCGADEATCAAIAEAADDNWGSGDYATQYDCIVKALDDAVEAGDIEGYTI